MAVSDWFTRLTVGDPRRRDYRQEDLPDTRPKLFFTVLKTRFWQMFGLNGLWLIFNLPIFVWALLMLTQLQDLLGTEAAATALTIEQFVLKIAPALLAGMLVLVPLSVLGGLGKAGLSNVMTPWAYDENEWTWDGFWQGVRKHWKQALGVETVNGVAAYVLLNAAFFYINTAAYWNSEGQSGAVYVYSAYFIAGLALIFWLMTQYLYPLLTNYRMKFWYLYRNAFLIALGRLPEGLLLLVLQSALPVLLFFAMGGYGIVALFVYFSLLGCVWPQFLASSFAHIAFDRLLNPRIRNGVVNRGLQSAHRVNEDAKASGDYADEDAADEADDPVNENESNVNPADEDAEASANPANVRAKPSVPPANKGVKDK